MTTVDDGIKARITNDSRQCVVDRFHEFYVQIYALVGILLPGLSEFGIGVGSEPNDNVRLARLHEFSFDLIPSSTKSAALARIAFGQLEPSIEFSLLSIG